jgi:hypothetical protein
MAVDDIRHQLTPLTQLVLRDITPLVSNKAKKSLIPEEHE